MAPPSEPDEDERRPIKRFSCDVRVGNWVDSLAAEEDRIRLFLKKRDRGELLVQKTRQLFNNLLKEVQLAMADEFVRFGTVVQLVAPDMAAAKPRPAEEQHGGGGGGGIGLALSGVIGEKDIDHVQHLSDGCLLSCSPTLIPCVRNAFVIVSADNCPRSGETLKYGQCFNLCPAESQSATPLYVRSETPTLNSAMGPANHGLVTLSARRDTYTRWRTLYWDPGYRLETEGAPIAPHVRVVISHAPTNQNLAVERRYWFDTFFGMECQTSVHSYRDVHRKETAENMWMFVTTKPVDNNETVNMCK